MVPFWPSVRGEILLREAVETGKEDWPRRGSDFASVFVWWGQGGVSSEGYVCVGSSERLF